MAEEPLPLSAHETLRYGKIELAYVHRRYSDFKRIEDDVPFSSDRNFSWELSGDQAKAGNTLWTTLAKSFGVSLPKIDSQRMQEEQIAYVQCPVRSRIERLLCHCESHRPTGLCAAKAQLRKLEDNFSALQDLAKHIEQGKVQCHDGKKSIGFGVEPMNHETILSVYELSQQTEKKFHMNRDRFYDLLGRAGVNARVIRMKNSTRSHQIVAYLILEHRHKKEHLEVCIIDAAAAASPVIEKYEGPGIVEACVGEAMQYIKTDTNNYGPDWEYRYPKIVCEL